ncbi:50S ribosomal protein L11 methyltransferase [bacterium]|nr:50S ribosomal protein L11 methyltransferase [bacterium]
MTYTYKGKNDWLLLKVKTVEKDEIAGLLAFYGAEGVIEENDFLLAYIERESYSESFVEILKNLDSGLEIEVEKYENDENWFENWKKTIVPVRVKPFLISPTWENPKLEKGEILIKLDPKMAFGTGSHETTQLILENLPKFVKSTSKIIDLGTGSGILAIASVKLGAKEVFGIDIDEASIDNAKENILLNEVEKSIKLSVCDILQFFQAKPEFNLAVVNIHTSVILEVLEVFSNFKGVPFLFSGILNDEVERISSKILEFGGKLLEKKHKKEWSFLVAEF